MKQAFRELFAHTSRHVSIRDIEEFCPSDPGYANYVRAFSHVLSSRTLPDACEFDITEPVNLCLHSDAAARADEIRFRRFRAFINAVGLALLTGAEGCSCFIPNYLAVRLIDDAHALNDRVLLALLLHVFAEAHDHVALEDWFAEETPFLSLGQLIVVCLSHGPANEVLRLADQVIEEADKHAGEASNEFLWGCTLFNQFRDLWRQLVKISLPADASNDSVAALRDALLLW